MLKFNVGSTTRRNPSLEGIGGVRNEKGTFISFSKHEGVQDSIATELLGTLEALQIYCGLFHERLIVEGTLSNALRGFLIMLLDHGSFNFTYNEIKVLSSYIQVVSRLEVRSGNSMVDSLAKKGMGRVVPVFAYTM